MAEQQNAELQKLNEQRPIRKHKLVASPDSDFSTESDDSDDNDIPLNILAKKYCKERENSDSEDGIPLMELSKRLKSRAKETSNDDQSNSDSELSSMQDQKLYSSAEDMDVNEVKVKPNKSSKTQDVKRLLRLISDML